MTAEHHRQPAHDPPPATGNPTVDQALVAAADSRLLPLDEQTDALASAHERLHAALDADRDA